MSGIIIQICRAEDDAELQKLVGAAIHYWNKVGYSKVSVNFESDAGGHAGAYTFDKSDEKPKKLVVDDDAEKTAVLVLST